MPLREKNNGQAQFRRLLEKLPAGAYTCDAEGLITYYNQRAVELWGRPPKLNDPVDRYCGSFKLFAVDGTPIRHDQCWMALAILTNREYNGREIIVERPDGSRLTALAHANPIHDDSGRLIGAVNVLVDITDRKRMEDFLREADRSKDEFLATLAHELRNPLAPLRNAVGILHQQAAASPEMRFALEVIDRQVSQMTRLIDDLLDIARITRNRLELRKDRVELADVVKAALETSRPLIEEGSHKLTLLLPQAPVYLNADPVRMAQALSNLINNAARYTAKGGDIQVIAEREGGEVKIEVRDNGAGIPAEVLPRIFDGFAQMESLPGAKRDGLGLGLMLVKRLVEMHDGRVEAHSDGPGRGSAFRIRVPTVGEPAEARPPAAEKERSAPNGTLRILVVDDNRDAADSFGLLLRSMGGEVRIAYDGEQALGVADEFQPNVVVMDIGLPRMNGYETARRLREQSWSKGTALIAVSGWGQDEDKRRSREAGFDHHMVKPVDPDELMALVAAPAGAASAA